MARVVLLFRFSLGTIKFCNDIELRTYHVGNHNHYAIGICLTGDFRFEKPTKEQEESFRNLVTALQKAYSHIKYVKGHNEFSGYAWKQCQVFDYKYVLAIKSIVAKPMPFKLKAPKKEYVTLPASAKTWRTYKLNVAPITKNSDWLLTPAAFGGLTYEVLGRPQANVVTIHTSRGKRNMNVGPGTSAKIFKR